MKLTLKHLGAGLLGTVLTASALLPSAHGGNHTWSGLGATGNFSDPQNWSSGGVPQLREANVVLIFPASATDKNPNQNIADLGIDQIIIQGDGYVFTASGGANYFLRGTAAWDIENGSGNDTRFAASANLVLNGPVAIHGSSGTVLIEGAITGPGSMRIVGPTVEYAGNTVNTYTGLTKVENGTLRLNKSIGVGFAGNLEIGINLGANDNERVVLLRASQIPDAADVTIAPTGWLNLNGFSDTVHDITMTAGRVSTGAGTLSFGGQIHALAHADLSRIEGKLNLGNAARSIVSDAGAELLVSAIVSGSGALNKHGAGLLTLSAANTFTGEARVHAGVLDASDSLALGTTSGATFVHVGGTLAIIGETIVGETVHLAGPGADGLGALYAGGPTPDWIGPVILDSDASIQVVSNTTLAVNGVISGPGGFNLIGGGELWLGGNSPNTHTGTNRVSLGLLTLVKNDGLVTIPGPLMVGHDLPGGMNMTDCVVRSQQNHPIANSAAVTILPSGKLDLNGNSDSIASLHMAGGTVETDAGTLTLLGNVTCHSDTHLSHILGKLSLGSQTRTVGVTGSHGMQIGAVISDAGIAGLTKQGPGRLLLLGANTYRGATTVAQGSLDLWNDGKPGSITAETIVMNGATLGLNGAKITNEVLVLNGTAADFSAPLVSSDNSVWDGAIVLNGSDEHTIYSHGGHLTLAGAISGGGKLRLISGDNARLTVTGPSPNTYSGATAIGFGDVVLAKTAGANAIPGALVIGGFNTPPHPASLTLSNANQIADHAAVTVHSNAVLNLSNNSETIGSLEGNGVVATQFATLTTGGNNFTTAFHGRIGGVGFTTLIKEGSGTMMLTGHNPYTGKTLLNAGTLLVHGSVAGPVFVKGAATLGGNGSVGNIGSTNGIVSPGAGPGLLDCQNVVLGSNSIFRAELNGLVPGVNCDQLNATGTVQIVNCQLLATLGFASSVGDRFVIINNDGADPVSGTFLALAEGARFTMNGQNFSITYQGGTGNDVVITHVNTAPQLTTITASAFVNEGGHVDLDGVISDPDANDAFSLVVNWGDGTPARRRRRMTSPPARSTSTWSTLIWTTSRMRKPATRSRSITSCMTRVRSVRSATSTRWLATWRRQ